MAQFNLDQQSLSDGQVVLTLSGWVDFANAEEILLKGDKVISSLSGQCNLLVDVGKVETNQSVLLSILLRWQSKVAKSSRQMEIQGLSQQMTKVAKLAGLESVLPI